MTKSDHAPSVPAEAVLTSTHLVAPLFFSVIPRAAIWGGRRAHEYFGYEVPATTGQVWAFSAQEGASTLCSSGPYEGKTLLELWDEVPEFFASAYERFPFIISLVAPVDDLSVQVHPTAAVARAQGYPSGKNEAWVILDSDPGSSLIYGVNGSIKEAARRIRARDFDGLFRKVATHAGDFFYIPAGTVHALGRGNIAYEIQQSTDLTYRIYDYDRLDSEGKHRPLDIDLAMESIADADPTCNETFEHVCGSAREYRDCDALVHEYIANDSFAITSIRVDGRAAIPVHGYWLCTVAMGEGRLNDVAVRFADNVLIPANAREVVIEGSLLLMITSEASI